MPDKQVMDRVAFEEACWPHSSEGESTNHRCCSAHGVGIGVSQDLDELNFTRSIVGVASQNDTAAVRQLLQRGVSANKCTSTGYTALVSKYFIKYLKLNVNVRN